MRYRVTFLLGLGAGYILGTRAGRDQYEQMRRITKKVAESPVVTGAVSGARREAGRQWGRLRESATARSSGRGGDGEDEDGAGPARGRLGRRGRLGQLTAHMPHGFGHRTHPAVSHSHNGTSHGRWHGPEWADGPDESDHLP